jgi:putative phosphoesterase
VSRRPGAPASPDVAALIRRTHEPMRDNVRREILAAKAPGFGPMRRATRRPSAKSRRSATVIGVVSDTHGLLRPEALRRLRGVDRIIHAGDVGTPEVLDALEAIAPVTAVRGNNDRGAWARALPETAALTVEAARFYVLHDVKALAVDPRRSAFAAVIAGHSHKPSAIDRDGVLFLNPGSIGPRRFTLPIAMALLTVRGAAVRVRIVYLDV